LLGLEVEGAEGGRPNLRVRGGGGDREDLSWDGGRAGRSYTLAAPFQIARREITFIRRPDDAGLLDVSPSLGAARSTPSCSRVSIGSLDSRSSSESE